MDGGWSTTGASRSGSLRVTSGSRIPPEKSGTDSLWSMKPLYFPSMEKLSMKTLEFTIAGGWWWCERCRTHHVECSPCPRDPNYVPADPAEVKARLDAAVDIRASEERRALEEAKSYVPVIELGAYTCICTQCGDQYQSDNKRSTWCGC